MERTAVGLTGCPEAFAEMVVTMSGVRWVSGGHPLPRVWRVKLGDGTSVMVAPGQNHSKQRRSVSIALFRTENRFVASGIDYLIYPTRPSHRGLSALQFAAADCHWRAHERCLLPPCGHPFPPSDGGMGRGGVSVAFSAHVPFRPWRLPSGARGATRPILGDNTSLKMPLPSAAGVTSARFLVGDGVC